MSFDSIFIRLHIPVEGPGRYINGGRTPGYVMYYNPVCGDLCVSPYVNRADNFGTGADIDVTPDSGRGVIAWANCDLLEN